MPEIFNSPYAYTDKQSSLEQAKEEKLNRLSDVSYEEAMLESLYDVDSPRFVGATGGVGGTTNEGITYDRTDQLTADRLKGIDSYEVYPRSEETKKYLYEDPHGIAKMDRQRAKLAQVRNVDVNTITNEDVFEEGAKGTLKELALLQAYSTGDEEYIQQVRDWTPSSEVTKQWRTQAPSFGSPEKPLNIPVDRAILGEYGYYGRPLTQVRGKGSKYLLGEEGAGYKYYEDTMPTKSVPSEEEFAKVYRRVQAERIAEEAENQSIIDEGLQVLSAVPTSIAKGALDLVDAGLELTTYMPQTMARLATGNDKLDIDLFDDGFKKSVIEAIDDAVGYDRRLDEVTMQKALADIEAAGIDITSLDSIKEGVTNPEKLSKLGDAALKFLTDPSLSVGMFVEIFGTGLGLGAGMKAGTKVASKAMPKLTAKLAPTVSKALQSNLSKMKIAVKEAGNDAAKIKEIEKAYTVNKKITDLMRGSVYTNADMMVRMNNDITAFKENNNGESPDPLHLLQMVTLNRIASAAEVFSVKSLLGIQDVPATMAKEIAKKGITKATGEFAGKLVKDGLMEGVQEVFDTTVEQLNQKVDAADFKNQSLRQIFSEASDEIIMSGIAGASGGAHFGALGAVPAVRTPLGKISNKFRDTLTKKISPEQAEPETAESNAITASIIQANAKQSMENTNPAVAYFSAFGSDDKELRVKASKQALKTRDEVLSGTHEVFASDKSPKDMIEELKPLVSVIRAEDPNISFDELLEALKTYVRPVTSEEEVLLAKETKQAYTIGQQFASIKPLSEVAEEVSDGTKGFRTYAAQAFAAEAAGDNKTFEASLSRLDYFYNHQKTKLARLREGEAEARALWTAKAEEVVRQKEAPNLKTAINQLLTEEKEKSNSKPTSKLSGKKIYHNDKQTGSTIAADLHVLNRLKDSTYSKGIYRLINTVQSETKQMEDVYTQLLQETSIEEPSTFTKNPVAEGNIAQTEEIAGNAEVVETVAPLQEDEIPTTVPLEESSEDLDINDPVKNDMDIPFEVPSQEVFDNFDTVKTDEYLEALEISEPYTETAIPDTEAENELIKIPSTENIDQVIANAKDIDQIIDSEEYSITSTEEDTVVNENIEVQSPKNPVTKQYIAYKNALKSVQKKLNDYYAAVKTRKNDLAPEEVSELKALEAKKTQLQEGKQEFPNVLKERFTANVKKFADKGITAKTLLYKAFKDKQPEPVSLENLVNDFKPTEFTLSTRTEEEVQESTKVFGQRLKESIGLTTQLDNPANHLRNASLSFLFDEKGELNYNTVEAAQSAVYEYLTQEASSLRSGYRTDEEIANLLGVDEESISTELATTLRYGGVTLKLAAARVGEKVLQNLGIQVKNTQNREALATTFGIAALQGVIGDSRNEEKGPGRFLKNVRYETTSADKKNKFKADNLHFIIGTSELSKELDNIRKSLKEFSDRLGIEIDKERTYRKIPKTAKEVRIHRALHQNAPKDHQDVVHRLENTAFGFNSGHDVLIDMFKKENGDLDTKTLMEHILGPKEAATNSDAVERYKAQEDALRRDLEAYVEAKKDVKNGNIFFNWFIAKNHRIHLDSNNLNPQNDKHLARWLVTALNSKVELSKQTIKDVLAGKSKDKKAIMFLYGLVQAFDGASFEDGEEIPSVDKDPQPEVLKVAEKLLDTSSDELYKMAMSASHIGHAALAIANIAKFNAVDGDVFISDMVLEVDGLTNGFAFRAIQFPVVEENSLFTPIDWLEKVGFIPESSELYSLESMSGARKKFKQEDVYISVGTVFNRLITKQKNAIKNANQKAWISFFEEQKNGLPDFAANTPDVKSFIRKLMKSPVMVFNYAAGIDKIANGLVDNQIMGTDYLSGNGLIDLLTAKEDDTYIIPGQVLYTTFGKEKGAIYHRARIALAEKSLHFKGKNSQDIRILRNDLYNVIDKLYHEPLKETLETLFSKQTEINNALTNAAQFTYDYFKREYAVWRDQKPDATEEDKINWLKENANIIPGVAGASSDDQLTKITFLKNALESTGNDVLLSLPGARLTANTVSRGYTDPGVGPAVLTVLSLDSSVMAKTLNQAYKHIKNVGALPIHDAIVLGAGEADTITSYNLNFYTTNKNYSIIQEFVNAIEELAKKDGAPSSALVGAKRDERISFEQMQKTLVRLNDQVQEARQELFNQNVKVGQLVGMDGTMAVIDIKQRRQDSQAYIAQQAENISKAFQSEKVKNALGTKYSTAIKYLNDLLDGCK